MTPDYVVIHGGGYIGLTGAVHLARAGLQVLVYDPDKSVVDAINNGRPKAGEFLGYLKGGVHTTTPGGAPFTTFGHEIHWGENLRATTDIITCFDVPVHVVCVPSEKNGEPFDEIVIDKLERLWSAAWNRSGDNSGATVRPTTVIVESTCTPGTIDKWLKRFEGGGVELFHRNFGKNYFLAVCPRRDWFADPSKNLETLTRIVGGVTPECTERAVAFLSKVSKDIRKTDYRTAELTKPLENAFLHVAVSLANEMATLYPHLDTAQAVELACTHWRLMPVHQNIGIGGRCVPLGPRYLREGAQESPWMLTGSITTEQVLCDVAARAVSQRIKPGGRVLVMGIAYRPEFKDAGSSPGLALAHKLWREGFRVSVADPMWREDELEHLARLPEWSGWGAASHPFHNVDAIVLATPHVEFREVIEAALADDDDREDGAGMAAVKFILDAQGAWADLREKFAAASIEYKRVGDPGWVT